MKKLGILFAVIIMVMLFAVSASAIEQAGQCGENVYYSYNSTTKKLVINGTGAMYSGVSSPFKDSDITTVVISEGVTTIGYYAFDRCYKLTNVIIPDSVTAIDDGAFYYCTSLANLTIPNSVTSIGGSVFSGCERLSNINIPNSVKSIGSRAFSSCIALNSITFPNDVETIGYSTFNECTYLRSITIPENIKSIGNNAFFKCENLTDVYYNGSQEKWIKVSIGSDNSDLTNATIHFAVENGTCGDNATYVLYDNGKLVINGEGAIKNYTEDSSAPWQDNEVSSIYISDGITKIGNYAFECCFDVTDVFIADSVTEIGNYAFSNCDSLKNINIPKGVAKIGNAVFAFSDMIEKFTVDKGNNDFITDENGVIYSKDYSSLVAYPIASSKTSYAVNDNVKNILSYSFAGAKNLMTIALNDGLETIGNSAFKVCDKLNNLNLPESLLAIGSEAFSGCTGITGVVNLPVGVKSISSYAFQNCKKIEKLILHAERISPYAFQMCSGLKTVVIEDNLTAVDVCAFMSCGNIKNVYYCGTEEQWKTIAFYGGSRDVLEKASLHYNCCLKNSNYQHIYTSVITKEATYLEFGERKLTCLCGDSYLEVIRPLPHPDYEYAITNNEVTITYYAGSETDVVIPSTIEGYPVTSLGNYVFRNNREITNIVLPDTIENIGKAVFGYSLESIFIPKNVKVIAEDAFVECVKLNKITVSEANDYFTSDENGVLFDCDKETLIRYPSGNERYYYAVPDSVKHIGAYSFAYSGRLKSIDIPNGVISIGNTAFFYCSGLKSLNIPKSVEIIDNIQPFAYCYNLENINVDDDNKFYASEDGVLFDKNKYTLMQYPIGKNDEKYVVPSSVTRIGCWGFALSNLKTIVINSDDITFEDYAFLYCRNLEYMAVLGVNEISENLFQNCTRLTKVLIDRSVTNIRGEAFDGCTALQDVYFLGTEEEWNNIIISYNNAPVKNAEIHFNHVHEYVIEVLDAPTHIREGEGTYRCECGHSYIGIVAKLEGHTYVSEVTKEATHLAEGTLTYNCECGDTYDEPIEKLKEHTYVSEVTKEPTHLAEGTLTYICECGDTYEKPIDKLGEHSYTSTITKEPTHIAFGETTFTCECGDSYTESIAKLEGHTYTSSVTKEPTHLVEGILTYTCECGDTYTESIEKIKKHIYVAYVIAPTCSEKGYTLNVCECGDSYKSNYVGMVAHSYKYSVIKPSSHLVEGLGRYTCSECGDHYDEPIAKTKEHSYISTTVDSTCTEQGYTLNECECGDSYKTNYLAKTDHNDSNSDGVCDDCGYDLTENCSCNCHKGGIAGFFFKLILFFQKIFKSNQICEGCGMKHY